MTRTDFMCFCTKVFVSLRSNLLDIDGYLSDIKAGVL
jgi:hypothetical protein